MKTLKKDTISSVSVKFKLGNCDIFLELIHVGFIFVIDIILKIEELILKGLDKFDIYMYLQL